MGSPHFSLYKSVASFLVLALIASCVPPAVSTSRLTDMKTGFEATLKRVDSGGNLTKFELLKRAMGRGRKRVEKIHAMVLASADVSVEAPVHAGNGEFLMELSIGSPPVSYSAILDTGSDLIWTQCKPCTQCFDQPSPLFDPKKSSSFSKLPCSSGLCSALPVSSCSDGNCEYIYTYGDTSSTQGFMATETFTFGNVSVPNIGFGCGLDNEGGGFDQGAGLVGLGRGPLSLVSQMDEPKFSYCLTSIESTKISKLLMGSLASDVDLSGDTKTSTPLIKNPSSPSFYYLSLKGISVGDTLVPIKSSTFEIKKDGTGGVIIDSGTTITYLEKQAFELVKKEFVSQIKFPVVDGSDKTQLDLCFTIPSKTREIEVPTLVFHFEGLDLVLPGENYFITDSSGIMCLAIGSSHGLSIFGNYQQQNFLVVHDLVKETMSFLPKQCDLL
ncbi:Eukaryotic aspartyl protease family protein [Dorcoceras hygrometricum]|uniref:Eukaryotic aspartyl protease family protein n=1 Tax=Dorcoceras hygrometricum TaxID=472368 RepID=A0A2Z7CS60_9LAMI|nr:Eukaryotic aspartyl protease family protein [Dorcoceras hygrometricum]